MSLLRVLLGLMDLLRLDKTRQVPSQGGAKVLAGQSLAALEFAGPVPRGLCRVDGHAPSCPDARVLWIHLGWTSAERHGVKTHELAVAAGRPYSAEIHIPLDVTTLYWGASWNSTAIEVNAPEFSPLGLRATCVLRLKLRWRALRRWVAQWRQQHWPPSARTTSALGVSAAPRAYQSYLSRAEPLIETYALKTMAYRQVSEIAFVMAVDAPALDGAAATVRSLIAQSASDWTLTIITRTVDAAGEGLRGALPADPRVRVCPSTGSAHQAVPLREVISSACAGYLAVLQPGDRLHPMAVACVQVALSEHPQIELLYTDHDAQHANGRRMAPVLKPAWNPELLGATNYIAGLVVVQRARVDAAGGWPDEYGSIAGHELLLRMSRTQDPSRVAHLPAVLLHRPREAPPVAAPMRDTALARQTNDQDYSRDSAGGCREPSGVTVCHVQANPAPCVSVLVPTRDGYPHLRTCIESVLDRTRYPDVELLLIDNQSRDLDTLDYLAQCARRPKVRLIGYDAPFNFSAIVNVAARAAHGTVLVLLNDDTEVLNGDWLSEMVALACRPDVGAVGAKLYYPDGSIQHAGLGLGIGGVAAHLHQGAAHDADGYLGRLKVDQAVGAVTGACLAVSRDKFESVGGMDEVNLQVALNDVDLCLKLAERGWRSVWTPRAELVHHESKTRGRDDTPAKRARFRREHAYMRARWGEQLDADPYYHPHLTRQALDLRFGRWLPPLDVRYSSSPFAVSQPPASPIR